LTSEERNLLSVGYKNTVASRRAAWRTLSDIQENEDYKKSKGDDKNVELVKWYKEQVENELRQFSEDIIKLLEGEFDKDKSEKGCYPSGLVLSCQDAESRVFYKKMRGDYYRYLCEVHTTDR